MFVVFEADWNWNVGGIWHKHIKGVSLGYISLHFFTGISFEKFLDLYKGYTGTVEK